MATMRNPLKERYYQPLAEPVYFEDEIAAARQEAIDNVVRKFAPATDNAKRQELEQSLRKMGLKPNEIRALVERLTTR